MSLGITWVVPAALDRLPDGNLTSAVASLRYRVLSPIGYLSRMGYRNRIVTVTSNDLRPDAFSGVESEVVVFSKLNHSVTVDLARHAKASGARVLFDMCDNYFTVPISRDFFMAMSLLADAITCNTPAMAEIIKAETGKTALVIDDPYESDPQPPRFAPDPHLLKLLWFGIHYNLDSLEQVMPQLMEASKRRAIELRVLTQIQHKEALAFIERLPVTSDMRLTVKGRAWSQEAQFRSFAECDAVVIPSLKTEKKIVKSANRVIESLRSGRPVIAQPLPSYEPFRPWIWLGDDLSEGIDWLYTNQPKIPFLIQMAQTYIEGRFSPQLIATQWERVIRGEVH